MKTISKLSILCSFFFFLNANAQAPNKFSFQAVVRNASNNLITNQSVGVKISLISVVMGTENAEFVETHTVTTNVNGLVSLQIGNGTTLSGDFSTAMSSNAQSKKIKCEIDPTGGTNYTIISNEQLLSVPYALFANTAGSTTSTNAWGLSGNTGTTDANFIGTTDDKDLQFKINNERAGLIETNDLNYANTTKNANTAFGYHSLYFNTIGNSNVANGSGALYSNTTGSDNVANGAQSLFSNTSGYYNVANGYQSLYSNTTGSYNTVNGTYALSGNTSGGYNVANGSKALYNNTLGNNNVANGYQALFSNTIGTNNTANGIGASYSNTTGGSNVASGSYALYQNSTGNNNVANGYQSLYNSTTADKNTAVGDGALYNITTGSNNTALGYNAGFGLNGNRFNTTCIGYSTGWASTGDNNVNIGNFSVTSIGGQVAWSTYSDKRIKNNIQENVPGLAFISKLKPVTYHLDIHKQYELAMKGKKDDSADYPDKYDIEKITQTGFLAQDVEAAAKSIGYDFSGVDKPKDEQDLYKLRYSEFVVPMVKAIQEQQAQIEALKKENAEIKALLERLTKKL